MSASIKFHTTGCMANTKCLSVTSESASHPIEYAFDFDPNSYWEPTSTNTQYIETDLGAAFTANTFALVIYNYDSLTGTYHLEVRYSSNGSDWTRVDTGFDYDPSDHITIITPAGSHSARYWKFEFHNQTTIPKIAMIACCKHGVLTLGNQYPENDATSFRNLSLADQVGNLLVYSGHDDPYLRFSRQFLFPSSTDWNTLNAAFTDARGRRFPFVMDEDDVLRLVRFDQDVLSKNEIDADLYNPTVQFTELVVT